MTILTPAQQEKLLTPAARRIMDVIRGSGGEARIVGGAVRDVLMGREPGDIDFAVNLPPDRVMEILAAAHIKTVPTGLAHGTITAVVDHAGYEITTLRRDLETDGRHAQIAFTDDWQADAARRDFTFNALYADQNGVLYDYFDGIKDAQNGHVRFIGDACARIREDVLRVLRFFRFYAWFGRGDADSEAVTACRELADLLPRLSAERVARETLKLLAAPNSVAAWNLMKDNDVLPHFLNEAADVPRLQKLIQAEHHYHAAPQALLRLAALLPPDIKTAVAVASRLKLANRDGEQLGVLVGLPAVMRGHLDVVPLRRILYAYGADACRAALLLVDENRDAAFQTIAAWENPVFPIKGEDIVKLGIPAGPRIGDILRATENWWIDGNFHADRNACLQRATEHGKNH